MPNERFKMPAFAVVILRKDSQILLIKRHNTGISDELWACAGGKIDGGETIRSAISREVQEELGVTLNPQATKVVHVVHTKNSEGQEFVGFFIESCSWNGDPINMEPHKCSEINWFDLNSLPQNVSPMFLHGIEMYKKEIFYSEYGWE